MYKNRDITLARLNVTTGWEGFNPKGNVAPGRMNQNLCGRLWSRHNRPAVDLSVASTPSAMVRPCRERLEALPFRPAKIGDSFGPTWSTRVFRLRVAVPPEMDGACVHLLWDSNSEALVMDAEGRPRQGLVGGDHHCRRADYELAACGRAGEVRVLYVEMACNGLFGAGRGGDIEPPDEDKTYKLEECCVAVFSKDAWDLLHDLTSLAGLAKDLPLGPRRDQALLVGNDVVNAITVDDPSTYAAGRSIATRFFSARSSESAPVVHSLLHSHIDLAWLWPFAATPAKGARTFSTQLRLLEAYPDLTYVQSQAQLLEWVRVQYPTVFEEIVHAVKQKRFVPVGATWVEMDTNLPSGEALVRQFTVGQAWFAEHFGQRCKNLWLPDCFGYACQLPQIMVLSGCTSLLTNKLSWNSWTKFPHTTFNWEGLDGSEVLVHMPPAETYNAQAFPDEVKRSIHDNKDAGVFNQSVMLVGHGDGGGGASPAMAESLMRMRDLDGLGKAEPRTSVDEFFSKAAEHKQSLPRVVGELYFELHRGTFTSQAEVKRLNRLCENMLVVSEMLCAFAMLVRSRSGMPNPGKVSQLLQQAWRLTLTPQFHDSLPGTSIRAVYVETTRDYTKVLSIVEELVQMSLAVLNVGSQNESERAGMDVEPARKKLRHGNSASVSLSGNPSISSEGPYLDCLLVSQSCMTPPTVSKPVVIEISSSCPVSGGSAVCQKSATQPGQCLYALHSSLTGVGVARPRLISEEELANLVTPACIEVVNVQSKTGGQERKEWVIANRFVQARVCHSGRLSSLVVYGQKGAPDRECIDSPRADTVERGYYGEGNALVVDDDLSLFWDAWCTEVYSGEKEELVPPAERVEIVESGPLRSTILVEYPAVRGGSKIRQFISLSASSARLDFRTLVSWKECRKVLRVSNLCTVRADHASYDSQFGFINRPTHSNTTADAAKFEVVGHKYASLSEYGFGVALLNDSKYGYSVRQNDLRLSLLRSPKSPDDGCDMGEHVFTFSLLGHFGSFPSREVTSEADALNHPPISVPSSCGSPTSGPAIDFWLVRIPPTVGLDSVVLSTVKELDSWSQLDRSPSSTSRTFIVRLFEGLGGRGRGCFEVSPEFPIQKAVICNLLEDEIVDSAPLISERNLVWLEFKPFQIVTVRVTVVV